MTDDTQSEPIVALNEALNIGFETADFRALTALHAEDAVVLPPRGRPTKGRAAIDAFWSGVRNRFSGMSFTTSSFKPLADATAREIGSYVMAAGEGGGTQSTGKYLVVWQKTGDTWLVDSIIWSRNAEAGQQQRGGQGGGGQGGGGQGGGQGGGGRGQGMGGRQGGGQGGQGGYRQANYGAGGGGGRQRGGIGGQQGGIGGGGAGIGGGGRRNPRQGGRQGGGGQQGRGKSLYDDTNSLYSNRDD